MLNMSGKAAMGENVREAKRKGLSERDAVLVSMKRSQKADKEAMGGPSLSSKGENYPYGLRIDLGHEEMKKLGMKKLPKAGAMHKFTAHAKVTRAQESISEESGKRRSMNLQIMKMKFHPTTDEKQADGEIA